MMSLVDEPFILVTSGLVVFAVGALVGLFLGRWVYQIKTLEDKVEELDDPSVVINKKMLGEHGFAMLVPGTYHLTSDAKIHSITVKKGAHLYLGGNTIVGTVYADGIVQ